MKPEGLYVNHTDAAIRDRTAKYFVELVDCCADLGGTIMVIGSPKQRSILENQTARGARQQAVKLLGSVLDQARNLGLKICFEPLSPEAQAICESNGTAAADVAATCPAISRSTTLPSRS